jgi:5-methylcytosine-specific restriction protein A
VRLCTSGCDVPSALARACPIPHCGRAGYPYCDDHKRIRAMRQQPKQHHYGRAWQRTRERFIQRIHAEEGPRAGLCGARLNGPPLTQYSQCAREGRIELGTEVDHITPHRGDPRLLHDLQNLELLCRQCHGAKSAGERETIG